MLLDNSAMQPTSLSANISSRMCTTSQYTALFLLRGLDGGLLSIINLGNSSLDELVKVLVGSPLQVGAERAVLLPSDMQLIPLLADGPYALAPLVRHGLDPLDEILGLLGLDLEHQLELVVGVPLRLLVELRAALHRAHDGLHVLAVVHQQRDGAAPARHHLCQFVERIRLAALLVDRHAQPADHVGIEPRARLQLLQGRLEVLGVLAQARLDVGEVERLVGRGLGMLRSIILGAALDGLLRGFASSGGGALLGLFLLLPLGQGRRRMEASHAAQGVRGGSGSSACEERSSFTTLACRAGAVGSRCTHVGCARYLTVAPFESVSEETRGSVERTYTLPVWGCTNPCRNKVRAAALLILWCYISGRKAV
ncbi:hypothetical protein F4823DRAFT_489942 [Ustulina deusta]|nr:hypothetical protein F4823DRAFT_489942 [Ustulina deusta]